MSDHQESTEAENKDKYFSADAPLTDPEKDQLEYAPFAKMLAKSIASMPSGDGLVMAINGPWGCGKSTVLNFVEHYLNQEPFKDKVNLIRFNPWWFSGHEDLTRLLVYGGLKVRRVAFE